MGVTVAGTRILEIGCGSGLITIPLAQEALQVTALDLTQEMLDLVAEEMAKAQTANIELRCSSWQAVEPSLEALQKSCDSVWAVRSTAITKPEDLTKMELCSKAWCVFAGADSTRRAPVMEAILAFQPAPHRSSLPALPKSSKFSRNGAERP